MEEQGRVEVHQDSSSEFISRVVHLPVVNSAIVYASDSYHSAKVTSLNHFNRSSIAVTVTISHF